MAAVFDEVLLDVEYSALARGGPEWSTAIVSSPSGFKDRNINRADFIGRWTISYDLLTDPAFNALYAFFNARRGRAYGFRFLAPEAHEVPADAPEQFGTGDGSDTTFQLQRVFTSGGRTYTRQIVKPMAGGLSYVPGSSQVKIYKDGIEQTSGVTVSSTTGIVTFSVAPSNGAVLTWSGIYHVPVTFGSDQFDAQIDIGVNSSFGIEIIEMLPVELGL